MNYVFFDIECANCVNGEGKICSFGYVKTDEDFKVIKKKDILINPDAPFILNNSQGDGISLAYPLFKFQRSHKFPHYYKEIQSLLEDENTIVFGFAVFQDVNFLTYTCKRYSLPMLNFEFYDIQKMHQYMFNENNPVSLDTLINQFNLTSYTYHRSDDDALMSMEIFKELLKVSKLNVSEALNKYSNTLDNTSHFLEEQKIRKKRKILHKIFLEKSISLFAEPKVRFDINLYNPNLYKKTYYIDSDLLVEEIDYFLKHKNQIDAHGTILTKNPISAQFIIVKNKEKRLRIPGLKEDIIYVSFESFKKEINKKGH